MHKKFRLLLLAAALLVPGSAGAATITAIPTLVFPGTTMVSMELDTQAVTAFVWHGVLSGSGITIDSITPIMPGGTDCSVSSTGNSFSGSCVSLPLVGTAIVAEVTITSSTPGSTLSLASGYLFDDSFNKTVIPPGVLVTTAIPEPGTGALAALGLLGLAWSGRRTRD